MLVVDKPAGLVCHPTKQAENSSLIGQLRLHFLDQPDVSPALLHRLDRETSGVLLVAKTLEARRLQRFFEGGGRIEKEYLAMVHGWPAADSGTIEAPLGPLSGSAVAIRQGVVAGGRPARTDWKVEQRLRGFALLRLRPKTGRLHQIRVHLAHMAHPVVGDKIYGGDEKLYLEFIRAGVTGQMLETLLLPRHALHAASLTLRDGWEGTPMTWTAPLPEDLAAFLSANA